MDTIFPDEVFIEIFRYLSSLNLFRGFDNLNSRLNRIIGDVRIHNYSRLTDEEERYLLPNLRPKKIRSFYVCEDQYQYPYLNKCINIRELIFGWESQCNAHTIHHPQLLVVQPRNFPYLTILTIYQQSWTSEFQKLCTMIFGNQFSVLKYLHLPYANGNCVNEIKKWSTSLTCITIDCCDKSMLYPLLENLSNLESFTCTPCTTDVKLLKNQCLALKHLIMTTYDQEGHNCAIMMHFEELNNLYRCFPNLESTNLRMQYDGTLDNALHHLHGVLSHCSKLKRVECHISYTSDNWSPVFFDAIKKRYSLFRDIMVVLGKSIMVDMLVFLGNDDYNNCFHWIRIETKVGL